MVEKLAALGYDKVNMKKVELFFTGILAPLDYLTLVAAGIVAYYSRFHPAFINIRPVTFDLTIERYTPIVLLVALVWIAVFALIGLYSTRRRRLVQEIGRIFLACTASMVVVFAILFFSRELFDSRFIIIAAWILAIVFVSVERLIVRGLQRGLLATGIGVHRIVLIGKSDTAESLEQEFAQKKRLGFEVVAHFEKFDEVTESEIKRLKRLPGVDEIIFSDPDAPRKVIIAAKTFSDVEHLDFKYSADLLTTTVPRMEVHTYAGVPVIEIRKTPLDGWGAIYKRSFDIIASLVLIVLTSPILLLTIIVIVAESGLPIIFKNERVGEKGRLFKTLKFRSMKKEHSVGAQKGLGNQKEALRLEKELIAKQSKKEGPVYKIMNDPRITPIGRFIRKYSIDELPQLFNVLGGNMSLVGPRPHQPREVQNYKPIQKRVLAIKPGLSGLAQISGRSDLDFDEEVRLDTYYIENWSPWLDLYIILKTPLVVIFRKGAY